MVAGSFKRRETDIEETMHMINHMHDIALYGSDYDSMIIKQYYTVLTVAV